ncbi:Dyp-type peroxidase [Spirulina sp. 06S082]|uniref:Dyp-type peroxidase n=1 Tax=Spirulina sp. 06S082 TaxID=3110248 RepID=UPI002B1F8728|nr:Dyp-type peroxidase [Spirulina sp. 06S082]MEA5469012.1 Dyp-type peroxidase [Spirulina sp. 06S082]
MALTEEDLSVVLENGIDPENPGKYADLLEDLQGNILRGHGRDHSVHLFLEFHADKVDSAKEWVENFAKNYIKSAQQQFDESARYRKEGVNGGLFANFFLSKDGYKYFGVKPFKMPKDEPFRFGMKNEAVKNLLGDPPVEEWETGYQQTLHALIIMADDDVVDLLQGVNQMTQDLRTVATIVHREDGFILRNSEGQIIEHFGFVDGISQPLFLKRDIVRSRVNNCNFSQWDPRAPLSIVVEKDRNGQKEDSYGSYLVYRKLEQNVKGWNENVASLAKELKVEPEFVGASTMGRFKDGTPLTMADVPSHAVTPTNNFNFDEDTKAMKCPFHAHIRKTNPRGDTGRVESAPNAEQALETELGHRIARRGISYGDNDINHEPETGSGLLFLCFQATIENQFNFIQSAWANQPKFVQVDVGPDPVISPPGSQNWTKEWGKEATENRPFKLWMKVKGGEYFFAPSISCLANMTSL